jgi:hypothetical protein
MPHCPPQISRRLTWYRTRASAVRNRRLNAFKKENQPPTELTEGGDLRESTSRRPSVCQAIPASYCFAGLSKRHLKYNWDCAYVNEFPVACEDFDVGNLRTIVPEVIGLIRGHNFGWKAFWDSKQECSRFKVKCRVNRDDILAALSGNNAGRAPSLPVIPWHLPHN